MTISVAAPARLAARPHLGLPTLYTAGLVVWLVTRWLVLVHQGAWPWMNAFVVAAARGIVVGDWNEAVRPQLPAVLGVPLVLAGASEQQAVAALYLLASLVQFGSFLVLLRALYPGRVRSQVLALLLFVLVPFHHSIHHYRDVPVVLASSAVFLLAAHWLQATHAASREASPEASQDGEKRHAGVTNASQRASREASQVSGLAAAAAGASHEASQLDPAGAQASHAASREASQPASGTRWRGGPGARTLDATAARLALSGAWLLGAMVLGVWSRTEVLTFVGALVLAGLVVWRRRALRLALGYAAAAALALASLVLIGRVEGVDAQQAARYQVHTFLDSTPESWLSPACRAEPTENCRERDGLRYFGPLDPDAGVMPIVLRQPLLTLAKTGRSGLDNLWTIFGPNLSTFPGIAVGWLAVVLVHAPARRALARLPSAAWMLVVASLAESVLPPLSWAPPHPQYHLQLVLAVVILTVPVLRALLRLPRGSLLIGLFYAGNAALSAVRYTRYPGY